MSTSVLQDLVKMAAHVWIFLEVTAVIVKQDILGPTVTEVRTPFEGSFFNLIFSRNHESIIRDIRILYRTTRGEKFHSVYINYKVISNFCSGVSKCLVASGLYWAFFWTVKIKVLKTVIDRDCEYLLFYLHLHLIKLVKSFGYPTIFS